MLLRKINRVADLWRESAALDEASRNARRLENHSEADDLAARQSRVATKANCMEWEVVLMNEAATPEGHAAKCQMVAASSFDDGDLLTIAWALGYEAGKLGLDRAMPSLDDPPVVPARAGAV